jgi:hypothetical protein
MSKVGQGLATALRSGAGELPSELGALGDCLHTVGLLLAEKAGELEPSWSEALAAAAEIETLLELERAVAERATTLQARSLDEVRTKIGIWKTLTAGESDAGPGLHRDRLILSIEADIDRL